jgi:Zn-dependent protease
MLFFDLSLAQVVGIAVALVVGITFHEFSHAFLADQLGDHGRGRSGASA